MDSGTAGAASLFLPYLAPGEKKYTPCMNFLVLGDTSGEVMHVLPNDQNYETVKLPSSLKENIANIRRIMGTTADLLIQETTLCGAPCAFVACEGMFSTSTLAELVLQPLLRLELPARPTKAESGKALFTHIQQNMALGADRNFAEDYGKMLRLMMSGFTLFIAEGASGAIAFGTQGYARRGVGELSSEQNIKGAKDGFVETIRVNISLVRRRLKSPTLRFDMFQMGSRSKTDVCLAYLSDRVPKKILKDIHKKLSHVKLETILATGYLEPFLEGEDHSIFHSVSTTERPDVLCAKLLEGRVALMVDGTPFVMVLPSLFVENFQTMDDYNSKPYYAALIRWLKYLAFLLAILLPGGYVAVATFHPELLNDTLLMNLVSSEQQAPFPLVLEAFGMLLMYEIIREAGLRLPEAVGGAVSLLGGLIIGDAAVSSGLVSTPLLIVVALAVVASFVIPSLNQAVTLLRLGFTILGGIGGLYAIAIALGAVLLNACSTESFGFPNLAPLSPFTPKSLRDTAVRVGFPTLQKGEVSIEQLNGAAPGAEPEPKGPFGREEDHP